MIFLLGLVLGMVIGGGFVAYLMAKGLKDGSLEIKK